MARTSGAEVPVRGPGDSAVLLRTLIGQALRRLRLRQGRTLREVADAAQVSMPYLSEVERGRKEASSEVLAAICRALGIRLSDLLESVRDDLLRLEPARQSPAPTAVPVPARHAIPSRLPASPPAVSLVRTGVETPSLLDGVTPNLVESVTGLATVVPMLRPSRSLRRKRPDYDIRCRVAEAA